MATTLLIIGIIFALIGIVGCIVPIIPGPPISYLSLLFLHWSGYGEFNISFLIILAILVLAVTFLDYILPLWTTMKFGGTKAGIWGATIGLFIGLFLGVIGIILLPFIGAVIGELISGKEIKLALQSGLGSFVGFLLSTGIKLSLSLVIAFNFFKEWLA